MREPKLTLDLVPATCFFSNLRSELPQATWNRLRRAQYAQANHRCEICGGVGERHPVECHEHWTYYGFVEKTGVVQFVQRLDGLIALCPACHEVKHYGLTRLRGRERQSLAHMARINGWDQDQCERYVAREGTLWAERSEKLWGLDVAWLEGHGGTTRETVLAIALRRLEKNLALHKGRVPSEPPRLSKRAQGQEHVPTPPAPKRAEKNIAVPQTELDPWAGWRWV